MAEDGGSRSGEYLNPSCLIAGSGWCRCQRKGEVRLASSGAATAIHGRPRAVYRNWFVCRMVFWVVEGQEYCTPSSECCLGCLQYGFATTEMAQMSLVACEHPCHRFRRVACASSCAEGAWGVVACDEEGGYGQDTWEMRDNFTRLQCIASLVHLATAFYQTPIVLEHRR